MDDYAVYMNCYRLSLYLRSVLKKTINNNILNFVNNGQVKFVSKCSVVAETTYTGWTFYAVCTTAAGRSAPVLLRSLSKCDKYLSLGLW